MAPSTAPAGPDPAARDTLVTAFALAMGADVSLGLARFSYALILPAMRADLGWNYFTAGAMNTANAAGYLAGALCTPWLMARVGARRALLGGSLCAALALALHGFVRTDAALYGVRFLAGVVSAAVFVSGGLMAARLSARPGLGRGITAGLVLGVYYGGTGLGIVACAVLVPPLAAPAIDGARAGWQWAWLALAATALLATVPMAMRSRAVPGDPPAQSVRSRFDWRPFAFGLSGYFMFGLGYIGYMTFIVTLLREQQLSTVTVAAFYALLGIGVIVSPWLWAGLLQRHRSGRPLAVLNALLAVATVLPVLFTHPVAAFGSGMLFGAVFLSVVASTTALVRHNLPPAAWPAGISAFTVVFAFGQIVGPSLVGRLSDASGGLHMGLAVSAGGLLLGAVLATRQRAHPVPAA